MNVGKLSAILVAVSLVFGCSRIAADEPRQTGAHPQGIPAIFGRPAASFAVGDLTSNLGSMPELEVVLSAEFGPGLSNAANAISKDARLVARDTQLAIPHAVTVFADEQALRNEYGFYDLPRVTIAPNSPLDPEWYELIVPVGTVELSPREHVIDDEVKVRIRIGSEPVVRMIDFCPAVDGDAENPSVPARLRIHFSEPVKLASAYSLANAIRIHDADEDLVVACSEQNIPAEVETPRIQNGDLARSWTLECEYLPALTNVVIEESGVESADHLGVTRFATGEPFSQLISLATLQSDSGCSFWKERGN